MRPRGDDPSAVHHDNPVGVTHRGEAMRDDKHGPIRHQAFERKLHHTFALRVEGAGRLVEQQDRTVRENRPGDSEPLPLPAGEAHAPLAELAVVSLRELGDEFSCVGRLAGVAHLGRGRVGTAVTDILEDAGREDDRVLRDHCEPRAQFLRVGSPQVDAVDAHRSFLRVVKTKQELEYGGLARAGRPDECHVLAGAHVEREPVERWRIGP